MHSTMNDAQDGAALEKRRSEERVEVSWVPVRQWQVFASVFPASLTVLPSTPVEGTQRGRGRGVGW
jgi:hypothetical protein